MKKVTSLLALIGLLAMSAAAQEQTTNSTAIISGPAAEAFDFITTAGVSNWMVAPYGIYDSGSKEFGGGIAVAYKLSDFVVPTLRMDYLHSEIWMPSADLQLQVPLTIAGKWKAYPFVFAGIATPVSGQHDDNGTAVGMFGAGLAIRLSNRFDLVGDVESWQGASFSGLQYRFGILFKL